MVKVTIRRCVEPTDANYGGWDMMAVDAGGLMFCFAEVASFDMAVGIVNGTAPSGAIAAARRNFLLYRPEGPL